MRAGVLEEKVGGLDAYIRIIKAHCEREGREEFQFYQAYYDPETKSIQHGLLPVSIHDADINGGSTEPGDSSAES